MVICDHDAGRLFLKLSVHHSTQKSHLLFPSKNQSGPSCMSCMWVREGERDRLIINGREKHCSNVCETR
jgi:hypothetical protein